MPTSRDHRRLPSWPASTSWAVVAAVAFTLLPGAAFAPAWAIESLTASQSTIVIRTGEAVAVIFTADAIDGAAGYSVTPPLPAGLILEPAADLRSAQITGIPTTPAPATVFTVTALDVTPDPADPASIVTTSATATVAIRVDGHLVAVGSPGTGSVEPPATPPVSLGSPDLASPLSFVTDPPLPAGLSLGTDGVLAGVASAPSPITNYVVTATDANGARASTTVDVRIDGGALAASTASIVGQLDTPVIGARFGDPAWQGVTYALTPTSPAGLVIDGSGTLAWTPSAPVPSTAFTVTARDSTGEAIASTALQIRVSTLNPSTQTLQGIVGQAITPTLPLTAAGLGADVTFSAALPPGLAIHPTNGRVTGRPTGPLTASDVVITATDASSATATASLAVTVESAQLLPPTILAVQAGSSPGSVRVLFTGSTNAPTGLQYAAEIYESSGTTLLRTVQPLSALADITGLNPGGTYTVIIVAEPLLGYLGSRSLPRSGMAAQAGERLAAPTLISAVGGSAPGSLAVSFAPSSGAPVGQTYTAQAFSEDRTTLVASRSATTSPITLTGLAPGSRYYVVVVADATPGFLESPSRGRFAVASGTLVALAGTSASASGGRPIAVAAAATGVKVGAGWFVHPKSASASALGLRVRGMPATSLAKAPTVRVPLNKAVVLRMKRLRTTRVVGVDLRSGRAWIALGPLLSQSATTIALPVLRATQTGSYVLRLRHARGISTYLKVMVTRQ